MREIPAAAEFFKSNTADCLKKRRTAAYARVSTNMEEQLTSYEAQVRYYTDYIKSREDWEFAGVYADSGITGTSTKHREEFKRMIKDALDGKIDLIITKSVSRFARNTVDSLSAIRALKESGTECYFEKENIWTFDGKGELLLTIMSSIAQEEARSISENCTWGQRRRFAEGRVTVPFKSFLGYERGEGGELVINEEQAKIVRRIFGMYLIGMSTYAIAKKLTDEGILSPRGKEKWYMSSVKSILANEKYKGDALLQKTYTADFLTKKKKINKGEIPQYYVKNNHEAIIEPEIFDITQGFMQSEETIRNSANTLNIFSGKIKCGLCDGFYTSKVWHSNDKYRRVIWQCNRAGNNGSKCRAPRVDGEIIKTAFLSALNKLMSESERLIEDLKMIKTEIIRGEKGKNEISAVITKISRGNASEEFDEQLWLKITDFVTVNSKEDIRVTFKNGITLKA